MYSSALLLAPVFRVVPCCSVLFLQHTVPTICERDGASVWEGNAIMRYLCHKHPAAGPFYPTSQQQQQQHLVDLAMDWRNRCLFLLPEYPFTYLPLLCDLLRLGAQQTALW